MSKIKIVTCANWRFRRHIGIWYKSVKLYMPDFIPVIRAVNWQKPLKLKGCEVEKVSIPFKADKYEKFYCAHQKGEMMDVALRDADYVVWMDADSIVLKTPEELVAHMETCDFSYIKKKSGRATSSVLTANKKASVFLAAYQGMTNHIEKKGKIPWTADQEAINILVPKWEKKIKFGTIPYNLCDWRYRKGMTIYNAKGHDGRREATFRMFRGKISRIYEEDKE